MQKNSKKYAGIGLGLGVFLVVLLVPVIPVYSQVRSSYQQLEDKQQALFNQEKYTLQPDRVLQYSSWVKSGHQVEFSVSASDVVHTSIIGSDGRTIETRDGVTNTRYGFTASIDDTYTFQVYNPHNGFLGFGSKTVGLYSVSATEKWQEVVTKVKENPEQRIVSVIQLLLGT